MIRVIAILFVTLTLAGCGSFTESFTFLQTNEKPIPRDIRPANFKQEIMSTVPSVVPDQKGIRDAYYSDPVLDPTVNTYASCVRFNARDSAGNYSGVKEYAVYYYGGHLNQFVAAGDQCKAASYKPFPELEKLCPGGKCR
jgi:hypothetical protein